MELSFLLDLRERARAYACWSAGLEEEAILSVVCTEDSSGQLLAHSTSCTWHPERGEYAEVSQTLTSLRALDGQLGAWGRAEGALRICGRCTGAVALDLQRGVTPIAVTLRKLEEAITGLAARGGVLRSATETWECAGVGLGRTGRVLQECLQTLTELEYAPRYPPSRRNVGGSRIAEEVEEACREASARQQQEVAGARSRFEAQLRDAWDAQAWGRAARSGDSGRKGAVEVVALVQGESDTLALPGSQLLQVAARTRIISSHPGDTYTVLVSVPRGVVHALVEASTNWRDESYGQRVRADVVEVGVVANVEHPQLIAQCELTHQLSLGEHVENASELRALWECAGNVLATEFPDAG